MIINMNTIDYKKKEKLEYYDKLNKDIWNVSLIFNHEEYGILLGNNNNNKFELPNEIVKKEDKSYIDIVVKCFLKKMISYDNIIVQEWLKSYFRIYYIELYGIEPNHNTYLEWYKENMNYLEDNNYNTLYSLKFTDIIKNIFENWIYENKVMVFDVPLLKNNENIKNRLFIINVEDMDMMFQELILNYSYYYEYLIYQNKKKDFKYMIWSKLIYIEEEKCMKNLQNIYDFIYMGIMI